MTEFSNKSFSVAVGSQSYRDNYDATFRKPGKVEEYLGFRAALHAVRQEGAGDVDAREEIILDAMDGLWYEMTESEKEQVKRAMAPPTPEGSR